MPHRVLVTGSAGRVGRAVVAELVRRGHDVLGLDLRETPGLSSGHSFVGSVTDAPMLNWLAGKCDSVVHLAATPDDAKSPDGKILFDSDNFLGGLLPNNVQAPYLILEAARAAKFRRVVMTSSGQVIDGHLPNDYTGEVPPPVDGESSYRPLYLYACTKVFLEMLGRVYAEQHGLSVVVARLGWCPRDAAQEAQLAADPLGPDVYLSPGDVGRFFAAAVEAEQLPPFLVTYATSRPVRRTLYDLTETTARLGFAPQDQWPG